MDTRHHEQHQVAAMIKHSCAILNGSIMQPQRYLKKMVGFCTARVVFAFECA
jgi:hypothetical protein